MSFSLHFNNFDPKFRFDDDGAFTLTSTEQKRVEDLVDVAVTAFQQKAIDEPLLPTLARESMIKWLMKGLLNLSESISALDASRPWLCFWIVHSLELLDEPIPPKLGTSLIKFLETCKSSEGGYGGGPGQMPHLATTYAAVMCLCIVGTEEAFKSIDRAGLLRFFTAVKQTDGSFVTQIGGEKDMRGAYCAAAVATLLNIYSPTLFENTAQWIVSCQTYEGGYSAVPNCEAHGGYTYCALATLILVGHERLCDTKSLLRWLSFKQMRFEGGFQGRTNKLVDSCYSFWQAACFPLIQEILNGRGDRGLSNGRWLFDLEALQNYVLVCCQSPAGGIMDKPEKGRDYYHTCYALSGLSVAQHCGITRGDLHVVGPKSNLLETTHPIYNISIQNEAKAKNYFSKSDE